MLPRYTSGATRYYKLGRHPRVHHRWLCVLGAESINMLQYFHICNKICQAIQQVTEQKHTVDNETLHSPGMARLQRVCATRVYYLLRNKLCVQNGILFTGDQIINLTELRVNFTTVIHSSNPGEGA